MDNNQHIQKVMEVETPVGDPAVIAARHQEAARRYPDVNLDSDEYVVVSIKRHSFGVFGIIISSMLSFIIVASIWITISIMPNNLNLTLAMKTNITLASLALLALSVVSAMIGHSIYKNNKFIITNERVVQWIVSGLFNQKKQTINLEAIEDISFSQTGFLQHLIGFGTVRLSTIGEESTYTFTFVPQPNKYAELLGDLVENAKENQFITDEMMELGRKLSA
ncbi:PH domain-containing protein [Candidatus Saccharibacteria bacterium]|nr:PH domain-containing protein [Candidatus Saccharibacteria bacterium]MBP9489599.1 PH domain-containing protein [Candidatus Saccharibacteria bacterium]MBP9552351.1 PH domain-containing protein [Candidatus Saccharibacteria bacterium]